MTLSFNTAGCCVPGKHYMLSPEPRLARVMHLIDQEKYFVFYAGRQTGKTTCAQWLAQRYNQGDRYACLWVDLQTAQSVPDPAAAMRTILEKLDHAVKRDLGDVTPPPWSPGCNPQTALGSYLRALCALLPRPLVLLFDEADGLVGPAMVSFLTQLRDGYLDRAKVPFPQSAVLIGTRQIRDYTLSEEDRQVVSWLGSASPFNISAEALTLGPFSQPDVRELLGQHTQHTGQRFKDDAVARIHALSQGHPWLVNAMADQIVDRDVPDRSLSIEADHVEAAKETLILERRTHIDSLIRRLHEPRVQRIVEPMLIGGRVPDAGLLNDDFAYVLGLGLIALREGEYQIANPIYKEVIPRVLSFDQQVQIHLRPTSYFRPDGGLDMARLMLGWQEFWRQDGHLAAAGFSYQEAGPHLMLMAYLQRIINGGGQIEREYGLGRGALDLLVLWRGQRHAIEVKLRRDTETEAKALRQVAGYLDMAGLSQGWLVMFDLRKRRTWKEKLTMRNKEVEGKSIRIVGC